MFTIEKLLDIAINCETIINKTNIHGSAILGVIAEREARRKLNDALVVAAHMERNEITEPVENIGPFESFVPIRGTRVRIKPGAIYRSMHPSKRGQPQINKRKREIVVHTYFNGRIGELDFQNNPIIINGEVSWVGTGGYWCHTDINNIEKI